MSSTSSEPKTLNLSSLVSKKTRRARERLLQNFGKADKTTDELFEVYQLNFNRQQGTALNLQKQVKHYVHCLKELHEASKGLGQCLLEMHEKDWPKHDVYENNIYELDHINDDLEEKLKETVLAPLEQYLGQFAEMREKISKRGRKLVDYDSQRHTFEALRQNQTGKAQQDDSKLQKHQVQLEEARKVYENMNNELHDELPALYDNRLPFIITVFQRLFSSEITYHQDKLALEKSYLETVEQLHKATEKGSFNSIKPSVYNNQPVYSSVTSKLSSPSSATTPTSDKSSIPHQPPGVVVHQQQQSSNGTSKAGDSYNVNNATMTTTTTTTTTGEERQATKKAPVFLKKVRATYKYMAEDADELSFEAGEIIQVIEYEDPSEQEEGWLMGIKESDQQKGLFPANFTKDI